MQPLFPIRMNDTVPHMRKNILLISAALLYLTLNTGYAAPCVDASLASYLETSCTIGSVGLSNFSFSSFASSPNDQLPSASSFFVRTQFTPGTFQSLSIAAITFNGGYFLPNGGLTSSQSKTVTFDISYDYQLLGSDEPYRISFSGVAQDDGPNVRESLKLTSPCELPSFGASCTIDMTSGNVTIHAQLSAFGGLEHDTAHVADPRVEFWLISTPEPSTLGLLAGGTFGLGCLAICRRRRR